MRHAAFRQQCWVSIRTIKFGEVARDALIHLLAASLDLPDREVSIPAVHRLQLAAVDGDYRVRADLHGPTQRNKAAAHRRDRITVVLAEVCDGLEVWRKSPCQPDKLQVPLRFSLEASAGLDVVEVSVDIDLEQYGGVIRRPATCRSIGGLEAQLAQIKRLDKGIDDPYRVVFVGMHDFLKWRSPYSALRLRFVGNAVSVCLSRSFFWRSVRSFQRSNNSARTSSSV